MFFRVAAGEVDEGLAENLVVLQIGLHHFHRNDAAVGGGVQAALADGHRGNTVGLVEGTGHAVYIDVAAQQDGNKISFGQENRSFPDVFLIVQKGKLYPFYYTQILRELQGKSENCRGRPNPDYRVLAAARNRPVSSLLGMEEEAPMRETAIAEAAEASFSASCPESPSPMAVRK